MKLLALAQHLSRDEISKDEDKFTLSQNSVGSTEKDDGYKYYEISLVCTYLIFNVF
jgi:hypothetical protein